MPAFLTVPSLTNPCFGMLGSIDQIKQQILQVGAHQDNGCGEQYWELLAVRYRGWGWYLAPGSGLTTMEGLIDDIKWASGGAEKGPFRPFIRSGSYSLRCK